MRGKQPLRPAEMTQTSDNSKGTKEYPMDWTLRHLGITFKALFVTFVLCCMTLVCGSYLATAVDIDPNSALFRLWPFNWIYLRQFANSTYSSSEIKWFFTVVSISNAICLVFVCWKFGIEFLRKDVAFPARVHPAVLQILYSFFVVGCFIVLGSTLLGLLGYGPQGTGPFAFSFQESIGIGAVKILIAKMLSLYVGVSFVLEFGGLLIRYWLSRIFGLFLTTQSKSSKGKR